MTTRGSGSQQGWGRRGKQLAVPTLGPNACWALGGRESQLHLPAKKGFYPEGSSPGFKKILSLVPSLPPPDQSWSVSHLSSSGRNHKGWGMTPLLPGSSPKDMKKGVFREKKGTLYQASTKAGRNAQDLLCQPVPLCPPLLSLCLPSSPIQSPDHLEPGAFSWLMLFSLTVTGRADPRHPPSLETGR